MDCPGVLGGAITTTRIGAKALGNMIDGLVYSEVIARRRAVGPRQDAGARGRFRQAVISTTMRFDSEPRLR